MHGGLSDFAHTFASSSTFDARDRTSSKLHLDQITNNLILFDQAHMENANVHFHPPLGSTICPRVNGFVAYTGERCGRKT